MSIDTTLGKRHVARIIHPPDGGGLNLHSLLSACDAVGDVTEMNEGSFANAFRMRLESSEKAGRLEQIPIVGVCGTVNSGKSSVVAGFLSPSGKDRVLVGELDSEGTHRFVFWLPASWKESGLGEMALELIHSTTGTSPEFLSDDPREAATQYNATRDRAHEFNIPLIGYDARLDESGIAFLDCPDTQRSLDDSSDEFTANLRLERFKTVAPLCSAFVVVVSMQQKDTEVVRKVFDAIASTSSKAPLYFVLNMTKTDEVSRYLPEAERTLEWCRMTGKIARSYMAPFVHTENLQAKVTPVITSMDEMREPLEDLGKELDPAELQKRHRMSCVMHLKSLLEAAAKQMRALNEQDRRLVNEATGRLCLFLSEKLIDSECNPRALEFNEAAKRMAESIHRTAPLPIRIAQAPGKWFRDLTSKWKRRDAADAELEKYGQIKSSDFSNFLRGSRFVPLKATQADLDKVWKQAMDAVTRHSKEHSLNQEELDKLTDRMWAEIPFGKKVALFKNVLIAMSAIAFAGMLLPFDGGTSIVIVAKAHMALGGTEILGMLVGGSLIGTLMTSTEAKKLIEKFESECARPQLDTLYAALADGLGIPRYLDGPPQLVCRDEVCHSFQESGMALLPDHVGVLGHPMIQLDEAAWEAVIATLDSEPL